MAQEGLATRPWGGGQGLDEGEDSLGQGEPVSEVVGDGESGGKPVPQPSDYAGGVEELSFQFNGGRCGGAAQAGGPPVDNLS